jgi:hypothetical protein
MTIGAAQNVAFRTITQTCSALRKLLCESKSRVVLLLEPNTWHTEIVSLNRGTTETAIERKTAPVKAIKISRN